MLNEHILSQYVDPNRDYALHNHNDDLVPFGDGLVHDQMVEVTH